MPDVHGRRAVFLLASQKTLPVAMAIISGLPEESFGQAGLVALPCIFGHLSQLIIDSFLVDYWAKHPEGVAEAEVLKVQVKDVEAKGSDPSAQVAAGKDPEANAADPSAQKTADKDSSTVQ